MSNDVTIFKLKCIIAVAQEGSESRAATRLHTNQSGVSRAVHDVEAEVGVRLLYTWHGGSRLTEAGKVFVEEILHSVRGSIFALQASERMGRSCTCSAEGRSLQRNAQRMIQFDR